jgi:hypothetical protein
MQAGRRIPKALLWIGVGVAVLLVLIGVAFLGRIIPRTHSVAFTFAGWTNDDAGARVAVLCISNRSHKPVMYWTDRNRQPRCDLFAVGSRLKQGHIEHIIYTNLTEHVFTGHLSAALQPYASVNCLLPWQDQYTNGEITVSYEPAPGVIWLMWEKFSLMLRRHSYQEWETVPLTGAPWTNAPGPDWRSLREN